MRWTRLEMFAGSLSRLSRLSTSQGYLHNCHHHHYHHQHHHHHAVHQVTILNDGSVSVCPPPLPHHFSAQPRRRPRWSPCQPPGFWWIQINLIEFCIGDILHKWSKTCHCEPLWQTKNMNLTMTNWAEVKKSVPILDLTTIAQFL